MKSVVKRQYNCGRLVRNSWMIRGNVYKSKEVFVEIAATRETVTVDSLIARYL